MTVYDFTAAKEAKQPHVAGVAICAACKHEWAGVAPVGATFLKCPQCLTMKGRFVNPVLLEPGIERMQCQCGCQVFSATTSELVCINCGESSTR